MVILLVPGTWFICAASLMVAQAAHTGLGLVLHGVLIYYALSAKSLRAEALKVYEVPLPD